MSPYNRGCMFFLSAFLIEEDTELQRTAAISDHLIKTLTGFLVKNDLDDGSYALMREVSTMKYRGGEGRVGMSSAVLDLGMWWWIDWLTTSTTLAILEKWRPSPPHYLFQICLPLIAYTLIPRNSSFSVTVTSRYLYLHVRYEVFVCALHNAYSKNNGNFSLQEMAELRQLLQSA